MGVGASPQSDTQDVTVSPVHEVIAIEFSDAADASV